MRVLVGLWNGGHSYSQSGAEDAEYFTHVGQARTAMTDRRDTGYYFAQTFDYVFKDRADDLTPGAHSGNSGGIDLWVFDVSTYGYLTTDEWKEEVRHAINGGLPDIRLSFGPKGGVTSYP